MNMKDKILLSAQRLTQERGFNGYSYADIADEVGIRKASIHHHFPTKSNLGSSLIEAYTEQLNDTLSSISHSAAPATEQLLNYIGIYRSTLDAKRMCLGCMFASEALTLDPVILPSVKEFFQRNINWLTALLNEGVKQKVFTLKGSPESHARMLVAALQGALVIARATNNTKTFDSDATLLASNLIRED